MMENFSVPSGVLCGWELSNCWEQSDLSEKTRDVFVLLSSCCLMSWSYSFDCLSLLCLHISIAKAWSCFVYSRIHCLQSCVATVTYRCGVATVTHKTLINTCRNVYRNSGILVQLMWNPNTRPSLFASAFCSLPVAASWCLLLLDDPLRGPGYQANF